MQSVPEAPPTILDQLLRQLQQLHQVTRDDPERLLCSHWIDILEMYPNLRIEQSVRGIRHALDAPNSAFGLSRDKHFHTEEARRKARQRAREAANFYILERRPDLRFVLRQVGSRGQAKNDA